MKAKQDPDWEKQVGKWVSDVTGETINIDDLHESLSDGQVLIKLVNTLKPGSISNWNKIVDPKHPKTALAATGNIRLYLAAVMAIGVPGVDMFLVDDLRTGRAMTMVCRNLASLCRLAVRDLGWKGPSIGPRLATYACGRGSIYASVLTCAHVVTAGRARRRGQMLSSTRTSKWKRRRSRTWRRCSICTRTCWRRNMRGCC